MPPAVARVAVNRPLPEPLDYALPPEIAGAVRVGMRVLVPLRHERAMGVVVEVADSSDVPMLRPLLEVVDDLPVFDATMLRLTRWMGEYYCCSWGEALACAAPPGAKWKLTARYAVAESLDVPLDDLLGGLRATPRQAAVLQYLHERGPATAKMIQEGIGGAPAHAALRALCDAGCVREVGLDAPVTGPRTALCVQPMGAPEALRREAAGLAASAPRQAAVLEALAERDAPCFATELIGGLAATHATLRALERKALVRLVNEEQMRGPDAADAIFGGAINVTLTDEQRDACESIRRLLEAGRFGTCLLEGVTGSGKTEVYLRAAEDALASNRDVIVLVPEISLTAQTVARFHARFDDQVAVLHSRLSAGERADQWRALQERRRRIAIGARSAVFAPVPRLGLVIVDEEHEGAYKQQDTPRYHARDVAVMRAQMAHAVALLGSATPSLESGANVQAGKYGDVYLRARAGGAPLPPVEVVDLRAALRGQRNERSCSDRLLNALGDTLQRKEQAIIFLNRRGYAPTLLCPHCGLAQSCEHCSVSMIWHQRANVIRCHYCNAERAVPQACAYCGGSPLLPLGAGTEKVEQELARYFPNARIARMDADTTSRKGSHARILATVARGDVDILVGTQMIGKGLDFPNVTLVGVVAVDTALTLPDFRAAERTAQMLMQVAGRSGRGPKGGTVIFQTFRPDHYAVEAAARHDYRAFVDRELAIRRELEYPPWRHLGRILCEGPAQSVVAREARRIAAALERESVEVLGPAPAPLARVQGKYRWHIQVLARRAAQVRRALEVAQRAAGHGANAVRASVDMDAYNLL